MRKCANAKMRKLGNGFAGENQLKIKKEVFAQRRQGHK